jgi:membrane protease YdiL (CAAX protease family)
MTPNERARKWFIWFAILLVTVGAVVLQQIRPDTEPAESAAMTDAAETSDADQSVADASSTEPPLEPVSLQAELTAKMTVALQVLLPTMPPDQLIGQAEALEQGGFADRMGHAILVGRVQGWERGVDSAMAAPLPEESVEQARALRGKVVEAMELRSALAAGGDAAGDGARSQSADLAPQLGFFAKALGPDAAAEAMPTLLALLVAGGWYLLAFLGGLVSLVVLGVLLALRKMTPAFTPAPTAHAALVLGETFALWISLFLLLQVAAGAVVAAIGDAVTTPVQLGFSLCAMFGSLVALAYPRLRGVSWSALRELLGLHVGRGVVRETIAGLHCYVTAVPLLVAGLIVFAILSAIAQAVSGAAEEPSHPVVDLLGNAGALEIVMLFALASVAAPIVEEIAFRGLLYGHLRGVVEPRIRLLSVLVAALMSSVVFAIIHPQGVLFVPALGGLAVGFCLFRELRGSLIAPMVAHGVSNAVTLSIGLTMMS